MCVRACVRVCVCVRACMCDRQADRQIDTLTDSSWVDTENISCKKSKLPVYLK